MARVPGLFPSGALCLQREALGDGGEFVAGLDFFGTEAGEEQLADGGDEGGAAGEEDAVDGGRGDAGLLEELVDGAFDGFEVRGDPRVELFAVDGGADVDSAVAEVEIGFGLG